MVDLKFRYGLPFCKVEIIHNNNKLILDNVLIDTGSGGTLFKMDKVEEIDITIDMNDSIETIHGVGGSVANFESKTSKIRTSGVMVVSLRTTCLLGYPAECFYVFEKYLQKQLNSGNIYL